MKDLRYRDKEWLKYQIEVLRRTQKEIGEECGVSQTIIGVRYNDDIKLRRKNYYLNNIKDITQYKKEYWIKNKEKGLSRGKQYYYDNKESIKPKNREYKKNLKIQAFNILGGCKCIICGEEKLEFLTVDHIDETGYLDKKKGLRDHTLYHAIINGILNQEQLSNLRVLCYNCNCSRTRQYLKTNIKEQSNGQKDKTKLWREAYNFFGPCKTCGDSELTHLTISHIHNDGAEKRKNGEPKDGASLIRKFRKLGWPESLKNDYCLECYNCNCSRKFNKKESV